MDLEDGAHVAREEPSNETVDNARDTPKMELVIFVGLQASGKSTFFRERFAATHEHVSKDLFRNNRNRNRRQRELVEAALRAEFPVVVDNTNPSVEERRALIESGHKFGARIVGYCFESGMREVPRSQCSSRGQGAGSRRGHLRNGQ